MIADPEVLFAVVAAVAVARQSLESRRSMTMPLSVRINKSLSAGAC
jgi:hypothetical protein